MKQEVNEEINLNYTLNYYKFEGKIPLREESFVK